MGKRELQLRTQGERTRQIGPGLEARRGWHGAAWFALVCTVSLAALGLAGCGKFFDPPASSGSGSGGSGSGSGGSTNGGDTFYVANANTSLDTIAAYTLTSGQLAHVSSSPYQLPVTPTTLAITPSNTFVYAGSELGAIYVYVVNTDGSLTLGNSSSPVAESIIPQAMVVDPTGKWLIVVESISDGQTIGQTVATVFGINTTNGTLTEQTPQVALDSGVAHNLLFNPAGSILYASLGSPLSGSTTTSGGVDVLTFNASTGALAESANLQPKNSAYSDIGLAINPAGTYLYVTETGVNGVRSFSVGANGSLTELAGSPTATDLGAGAVLVDATGSYLYVANSTAGTISSFSIGTTGALTSMGAATTTGISPVGLVEDNSKSYIGVVCSGGDPDFELFKLDTTTPGVLDTFQSVATGTVSPAQALTIVATH